VDARRNNHFCAKLLSAGPNPPSDLGPVWTPDGKWIVFRSFRGDAAQLEAIRPDGSERHTVSDRKDIGWPRISPDGKRIAFQSNDETGAKTIVTVNLDGSDLRTVPTGLDRPWDPVWSPDGTQLVFAQQPPDSALVSTSPRITMRLSLPRSKWNWK